MCFAVDVFVGALWGFPLWFKTHCAAAAGLTGLRFFCSSRAGLRCGDCESVSGVCCGDHESVSGFFDRSGRGMMPRRFELGRDRDPSIDSDVPGIDGIERGLCGGFQAQTTVDGMDRSLCFCDSGRNQRFRDRESFRDRGPLLLCQAWAIPATCARHGWR